MQQATGMNHRIVSYNVRYFGHALRGLASTRGSKREIAAGIADLSPAPSLICLQEVETRSFRSGFAHERAHRYESQLESFMNQLEQAFARRGRVCPYEAFYFRAHTYRLGDFNVYTTGLAVLVDIAALRVDFHNVESPEHITHHHVMRVKDRKQTRISAHMRLTDASTGRPLHVFNTHLSLPTPFCRQFWSRKEKMGFGDNQLREAEKLVNFVRRHAGSDPYIVCGDFNSAPGSPVYRYLSQEVGFLPVQEHLGLIDATVSRAFPTAGFMGLRMHLDHLFSSPQLIWEDCDDTKAFGDVTSRFHGLSDHTPLIGRFRLPDDARLAH